jgi:hypothetical protein
MTPLRHLFNFFILIGFSPEQWRDAYLTPIAKVDHPQLWSDYRPISLTFNLCKTFERVLVRRILQLTHGLWAHNKQHGFLPGHSTADAVVQVLFDIGRAVDQGHPVLAILFDFAKAFDLVPHDKLLTKLQRYLLVKWVAAYLRNRRQRVQVGQTATEWMRVEAGVIQESVLGPVLFLLYIYDINTYLPQSSSSNTEKYADDIISYIIGKDVRSPLPQEIVDSVQRWCDDNLMKLNARKCEMMYFPPNKREDFQPIVKLGATTLKVFDSYKYLGFLPNTKLDSNIQWDRFLSNVSSAPHLLRQLKKVGLSTEILINVLTSLVLSHFCYSGLLLDSCSERVKSKMQHFLNKLLRIIGVNRDLARSKYGIEDISVFIERTDLEQTIRVLNSSEHSLPASLLSNRKTHSSFPFTIPRARTTKFNDSMVLKALRHLRVHGTGRKVARLQTSVRAIPTKGTQLCPSCSKPFKPVSMH